MSVQKVMVRPALGISCQKTIQQSARGRQAEAGFPILLLLPQLPPQLLLPLLLQLQQLRWLLLPQLLLRRLLLELREMDKGDERGRWPRGSMPNSDGGR